MGAVVLSTTMAGAGETKREYIDIDGLKMYYEVHGQGRPLVLLHGAFGTADSWDAILPHLVPSRQVIVIEQQGHGRTLDRHGPLRIEKMADDTAMLLRSIGVKSADVFGYSNGGLVGLSVAMRHPGLVNRLAVLGAHVGSVKACYERNVFLQLMALPDDFAPPALRDPYDRVSPDKSRWPVLVKKIKELARDFRGFSASEVRSIQAPTLIMQGDRDVVRPEHAVEMMRLIPNSRLAVLANADHFILQQQPEAVTRVLVSFLDSK